MTKQSGKKREGCTKVKHLSRDSAKNHAESLSERYTGKSTPSIYICDICTRLADRLIYHVGYGYQSGKLSKRARRQRKERKAHSKRKRGNKRSSRGGMKTQPS